jgi:hypothetical protein
MAANVPVEILRKILMDSLPSQEEAIESGRISVLDAPWTLTLSPQCPCSMVFHNHCNPACNPFLGQLPSPYVGGTGVPFPLQDLLGFISVTQSRMWV